MSEELKQKLEENNNRRIFDIYKNVDGIKILHVYNSSDVDEYYKKQFKAQAKYFWEDVEDKIGYQYKMSYKVLKEEQMDEYDIEELNKSIHEISNKITFKKVKKVTLEVTAKGKTKTCSKNLDIYMSKESGKWLVICTDDMGSISYMIE